MDIVTDIGGHYNTSTGIFTCQYPGIYVFALQIMKNYGSDSARCAIRKNGSIVLGASVDPDTSSDLGKYSSSNSAVMHLVQEDQVDLGYCSPLDSIMTPTTFSGFLLKAD